MSLTLTPAQAAALDALVSEGSQKRAAARLGVSERSVRRSLERARRRNGMATTVQLAYWHRRTVWDRAA